MNIYKIRNLKSGLFSTGGRYASWHKEGKIWDSYEDTLKAIQWKKKDEEAYYKLGLTNYEDDLKSVKRHNKRSKNKYTLPKKPVKKKPFYRNVEIVEFRIKETKTWKVKV